MRHAGLLQSAMSLIREDLSTALFPPPPPKMHFASIRSGSAAAPFPTLMPPQTHTRDALPPSVASLVLIAVDLCFVVIRREIGKQGHLVTVRLSNVLLVELPPRSRVIKPY